MNMFDIIAVASFIVVLVTTVVLSILFSSNVMENFKNNRIIRLGSQINWMNLNSFIIYDMNEHKAYGLIKPCRQMKEAARIKDIKRQLNVFLKHKKSRVTLEELSNNLIVMNNYSFRNNTRLDIEKSSLSLEQILYLTEHDFNPETVAQLRYQGVSFEDIKSSKGLPAEWVAKVFTV